jgi:hypothetical protein
MLLRIATVVIAIAQPSEMNYEVKIWCKRSYFEYTLMLLGSLFFAVTNLTKDLFQSPNYKAAPFILFPYFPQSTEHLGQFTHLELYLSDRPEIATAKIDCLSSISICSSLHLRPDRFYVSFSPHDSPAIESLRPVTNSSLEQLSNDILSSNLRENLTFDDLPSIAAGRPLFVLAARSNAGDLEVKLPIFRKLAHAFIAEDLTFAFVTDPITYDHFAQFPLTSLVFVPPSLQSIAFAGNFSDAGLRDFVERHRTPVFGTAIPLRNFSLLYIGTNVSETVVQQTKDLQGKLPLVFVDRAIVGFFADWLCGRTNDCSAILDADGYRILKVTESDTGTVLEGLETFEEGWNEIDAFEKVVIRVRACLLVHDRCWQTAAVCATVWVVVWFVYIVVTWAGKSTDPAE